MRSAWRGYNNDMLPQSTTHVTLLARLAHEGDEAWNEFHERYGELIHSFARRRGMQPTDCDDVAQDVLLSLTKTMPGFRYDPTKGKFRSYLKTVTLHAVFKRSCQKRGEVNLEHIEQATRVAVGDDAVDAVWEAEWRQYHLRQALRLIEAEFNAADFQAFKGYAIEGGDVRETAEALELTVDQVYQAKSRIMKRLTQFIERQVEDEG